MTLIGIIPLRIRLVVHHDPLPGYPRLTRLDEHRSSSGVEPVVDVSPRSGGEFLCSEVLALQSVDVGCESGRVVLEQPPVESESVRIEEASEQGNEPASQASEPWLADIRSVDSRV